MGFELFGSKKSKPTQESSPIDISKSKNDDLAVYNRRQVLLGLGAVGALSMLPTQEAKAYAGETKEVINSTKVEREKNAELLTGYAKWIKDNQAKIADVNLENYKKLKIITHELPALERSMLEGTSFDHEQEFRSIFTQSSWPSVRAKNIISGGKKSLDYAHEGHLDKAPFLYGNVFFMDGILVSNRHVIANSFDCVLPDTDAIDIATCALYDISQVDKESQHVTEQDTSRVMLTWDRRKAIEDLHGKIVHIPSIHQERGADDADKTDITSGVLVKISPDMPKSLGNNNGIMEALGNEFGKRTDFTERMKNSYFCIIGQRDTNGDKKVDGNDFTGVSGSPIFTDEDCALKKNTPSGIVWGVSKITTIDEETGRGVVYTVALIHGADVLGKMIDTTNIIASHIDEKDVPYKKNLVTKIQKRLAELGYDVGVDGDYGGQTQRAIDAFQKSVFSEETLATSVIQYEVDRRTWDKLFPEMAGVAKEDLYVSLGK